MATIGVDQRFVVDRRLGAVPMDRLLEVRDQLRRHGRLDRPQPTEGDRPVLDGEQALQPGTLYVSEHNPVLRYYLPRYQVLVDAAGRPAVQLRYDAAATDGNVGSLALTLTWAMPVADGVETRPIEHVASLALRYRVPVEAGAAGAGIENTIALQPLQPVSNLMAARSVTQIADKALFDTVYQALRSPMQGAALEITIKARVGMRTWRQMLVGRPAESDQVRVHRRGGALFTDTLQADRATPIRRVPQGEVARVRLAAAPAQPAAASMAALPAEALTLRSAATARRPAAAAFSLDRTATFAARPATATFAARPAAATFAAPTAAALPTATLHAGATLRAEAAPVALARLHQPNLAQAVAASDMRIAGRNVVPTRVALDRRRRPAIVDADLEAQQSLAFCFDPQQPANASVFAAQGYTEAIHLLLPLTLTKDGRIYRVFQDNLMRDVIHITPTEFRLQRDTTAPFLPELSFLAGDFGTTDNDTEADVLFRVAVAYRLEPWLAPEVVELTRIALAEQKLVPRFTTSIPPDAKLTIELDLPGVVAAREGARIDAGGIDDALDLDHNAFVRLWRERLAPAGGGVSGGLDYKLFDGTPTRVPVRLSLWDASTDLFDVALLGPVADQPSRCRVSVRNRIESPVEIVELPPEVLAAGGVAHAVDAAAWLGKQLPPQQAVQIDYELSTGAVLPADFDPSVLGRAIPKLDALLRLLMVTPGYASLGFSLVVKAADGSFAPVAAGELLVGLLVEFDDGTRTTLTPALPQDEVQLLGRLVDQLMGEPDDSQRFFYRVTNLHASGEGARTSWLDGQGTAALQVGAAQVKLDF